MQCWGSAGYGQLGNGRIADSLTPVSVSGITTAAAITAQAFRTVVSALAPGNGVRIDFLDVDERR